MSNLLFVYQRKMATTEGLYEVFTSEAASFYGLNCKFVTTDRVDSNLLLWTDVVVFVRNLDLLAQMELRKSKEAGLFCIQFFDDDVMNLPPSAVNRVQYLPWRKKAIKNGFTYTDLILSSNQLLAKKYSKSIPSHRNVAMDTVVDPSCLINPQKRVLSYRDERVKIVYAAGANHEDMFNKYILPIIPRLNEKYGDRISFSFFGVHPNIPQFEKQMSIEYIGSMSLEKYRRRIQKGSYDIGLSPLESNDFTKYKYYNKFIEYTIAGAVGVYSRTLPYTLIVNHENNGFLADNNTESWFQVLCTAIDNVELRKSCYKNAYKLITSRMSADCVIQRLKHEIPELDKKTDRKKRVHAFPIKIIFLSIRIIECIYLVGAYVKSTGIKGAITKIKSYIEDQVIARREKLGE